MGSTMAHPFYTIGHGTRPLPEFIDLLREAEVTMLADGSANFAKALGLEMDITARGMGVRSQRYALVAEDGKVTHLGVEAPGGFEASKAETILAAL